MRALRVGGLVGLCALVAACGDSGGTGGGGSTEGAGGGAQVAATATGAGGGAGSTSTTGAGGEGGGAPAGKVAVFVAQGHVGTTLISCDDGASWTAQRSFDAEGHALVCDEVDAVRCFEGACSFVNGANTCQETASECDCDHHPGSGKGLAFGDGAFVATFGWGAPGVVLRSTDGVAWTEVSAGQTYADVAAGNGMIALSDRTPAVSTDGGLTYAPTTDAAHVPWNVRRLFYLAGSQRFLQAAASGEDRDVRLTSDFTAWSSPSVMPASCLPVSEAVEGDGVIVTRGTSVCRSTDGGDTFEVVTLPGATETFSGPVFDGAAFLVWGTEDGASRVYRSADGAAFTAEATNLAGGNRFGEVARNPVTGTLVAARDEWTGWYEEMRWYRSQDGVTWETLSTTAGPATHPIRELTFGFADPSEACPL